MEAVATERSPSAAAALLAIPGVWRGDRRRPLARTEKTGSAVLDELLLGGWPQGSLSEIVSRYRGFGFSLIVPVLARLTQAGRAVALVNTPYQPYAPALDSRGIDLSRLLWIQPSDETQALWSVEQLLRSEQMGAVALWTRQALDTTTERRLQLAAETSRCLVFAFRSGSTEGQSYAALKLAAAPAPGGQIRLETLKCRGGRTAQRLAPAMAAPLACRAVS